MTEQSFYDKLGILDNARRQIQQTFDGFKDLCVKRNSFHLPPEGAKVFDDLEKDVRIGLRALRLCVSALEKALEKGDENLQEQILDATGYGINEIEGYIAAYIIMIEHCEEGESHGNDS